MAQGKLRVYGSGEKQPRVTVSIKGDPDAAADRAGLALANQLPPSQIASAWATAVIAMVERAK